MARYAITSQQTTLGTYDGATAQDALDAMAREAGYDSHTASCEVTETDASDWTESRAAFRRGTIALLVEEIEAAEYLAALRIVHPAQWTSEIRAALVAAGSLTGAAEALGVGRQTLVDWTLAVPALTDGVALRGRGRPAKVR